ncbi:MAG: threonine synthase [Candidatus Bathyarchaeia archaeon]
MRCRECGSEHEPARLSVCPECLGPLDAFYDYGGVDWSETSLSRRPRSLWRYRELLPLLDYRRAVDLGAGLTPLRRADRLARALGLREVYLKDDTVNPTYSFKDRPASVAVSKALELGYGVVGCASTGNLAAATAAHAAKAGLPCYVFIPKGIEGTKISQAIAYGARIVRVNGTYDEANAVASRAAERFGWALVNINIRPYYVEGSKSLAFEVCEQLGWEAPDHVIVPIGSGALLNAIAKGFGELRDLGFIEGRGPKISGAQGLGCSPVVDAFKSGRDSIEPVEAPSTIAKSLAIGDPGDGVYALRRIRESGGFAEAPSDSEITEAIRLLGRTEGLFTEPAGAVTVAALKRLVSSGAIEGDERVVCYITGNGLKAPEAVASSEADILDISPALEGPWAEALEVGAWRS